METKTAEDFLWGAIIGGVIGAATALMLTPVSGEALRKKIRNGIPYPAILDKPHRLMRKRSLSSSHAEKRGGSRTMAHHNPPVRQATAKAKPKHKAKKKAE